MSSQQSPKPPPVRQVLVDAPDLSQLDFVIREYDETNVHPRIWEAFSNTVTPIGLSIGYCSKGNVKALAVSILERCLIINFTNPGSPETRQKLEETILCSTGEKYAFDMERLSLNILDALDLRIANGVDIQSAFEEALAGVPEGQRRQPLLSIKECLGSNFKLFERNIAKVFEPYVYGTPRSYLDLAQQAWLAYILPTKDTGVNTFGNVKRISTIADSPIQRVLAKIQSEQRRLDALKETTVSHEFETSVTGNAVIQAAASSYKSKFLPQQHVNIRMKTDYGEINTPAQTAERVSGRTATIHTDQGQVLDNKTVTAITSLGRQAPTQAENARDEFIRLVVQGTKEISENPWFQNIFLPRDGPPSWPEEWTKTTKKRGKSADRIQISSSVRLNDSQRLAVEHMLSPDTESIITVVQGPPGTGKTSVIASFVRSALDAGRTGLWLIAETNVAVKNIAEKLMSLDITEWRLLVSKDFHFDWHEHIYERVKSNIIRSDQFGKLPIAKLQDCKVVLCTLSMMSSPRLGKFICRVPVKTLVVDEASQININGYLHCFDRFQSTLRKVCFIGDDKQLPPHGQESIETIQSIFEIQHLSGCRVFLDTQYRMPPQLGDFISTAAYEEQLRSNPAHPIKEDVIAVRFFDVPGNEVKGNKGTSYQNRVERDKVLEIARILQNQGRSYKIITPYEAQQHAIEDAMKKDHELIWEDKVFIVDSFQGNEEDYIVLSLVRSRDQGFLRNLRRTNVMLTRCKKGMFVVSSRKFLQGAGATSLAGKLLEHFGEKAWMKVEELTKESDV